MSSILRMATPARVVPLFAVLALAATLGACAQPDNSNRLTSAVPMVGAQPSLSADPYHYRCAGNCQAGM
jgi:ABC-type uncharacterized transport system auxiliary subunit